MTNLKFLGATETVTGSKYLLETGDQKFLIDCGLFQGRKENRLKNWGPLPILPKEIDHVFLTHAHIDHSGYLPRLCSQGFDGAVHCTHATRDLCDIMLKDSAHIQEEDAFWANKKGFSKHSPALPLYTLKDAEKALTQFRPFYYGQDYYLENTNIRIKFKDAGHILGSSFVEFKKGNGQDTKKILFSGDIGRPSQLVIKDPLQVFNVDYLVLESTYGDRLHTDFDPVEDLARVVNDSHKRGGVLVIPSFAVGRTQTILYVLRELEEQQKIPSLPVFIDSPMAINSTKVFEKHVADFNLETRTAFIEGKNVFQPKHLSICRQRADSIAINKIKSGAIIISASGMATSGRILHHLAARLPNSKNTILFIGYQAEGTRGRSLLDGAIQSKIHGQKIPVKAHIEKTSGFSGHGDYNEILAWLMGFNKPPKKTFIVHGDGMASQSMAQKIKDRFGWDVVVPKYLQDFKIDF